MGIIITENIGSTGATDMGIIATNMRSPGVKNGNYCWNYGNYCCNYGKPRGKQMGIIAAKMGIPGEMEIRIIDANMESTL